MPNYVPWARREDLEAMLATTAAQAHITEVAALADGIDPVPYRVVYVGAEER